MTDLVPYPWTVVLPVKVLANAKSRLAVLAGSRRADLALALASDTVAAVVACAEVARVLVVTSDATAGSRLAALGALLVPDEPGDGLNVALRHGASVASARWPGSGVAALSAPKASVGLRIVIDNCLDGVDRLLRQARRLPFAMRDRGLGYESAAILALAERLAAKLRREDPIARRVKLSKPAMASTALGGVFRRIRGYW